MSTIKIKIEKESPLYFIIENIMKEKDEFRKAVKEGNVEEYKRQKEIRLIKSLRNSTIW